MLPLFVSFHLLGHNLHAESPYLVLLQKVVKLGKASEGQGGFNAPYGDDTKGQVVMQYACRVLADVIMKIRGCSIVCGSDFVQ